MAGYGKYAGKSEEERRKMFEEECAKHPLADQLDDLKKIEGFPIGKDEDIIALSDTPYYTACPNPYINEFIEAFGTPYDPETDDYERTPFVSDVSEGKNDPIYNAHSYHTKVPHKAIMPFIEHYTEEGDIVFDGFCGTGMTGVAAQFLKRNAIISDLSPAASFIAYNYNIQVDIHKFEKEAKKILSEVKNECGWMFDTFHTDGKTKGKINYTVWSDVLVCPYCNQEYVFWEEAVDKKEGKVKDGYPCPNCNAIITKRECNRYMKTYFDSSINQEIKQAKQVPVQINYSVGKKRYEKVPDGFDLKLIKKIEEISIPYWFPKNRMPEGYNTKQPEKSHGLINVHHFYTKRNLWVLASLYNKIKQSSLEKQMLCLVGDLLPRASKMHKIAVSRLNTNLSKTAGVLSGTLYIPSNSIEYSVVDTFEYRYKDVINFQKKINLKIPNIVSANSVSSEIIPQNCIDYIFTDPPFGGNLMYSELNFLWESWLKVHTNNSSEAIINQSQSKSLTEYKELMTVCFKEMYRVLKPNRWITVEFHNSKASVWNAIQDALTKAGFIIAQVTVLDKKQGSFKQVTSAGAVKNDLIINAYKPRQQFEEHFLKIAGVGLEKDFVAEHISHLPIEPNIERTEQMLFSKMLAHYIQNGFEIRLNAPQFYNILKDHFKLIDGYWFLDDEVPVYDEWKKEHGLQAIEEIAKGQQMLFVSDEKSMLIWLYNFLSEPKSYSDIYTASRQVISTVEDQLPELKNLLETNFISENGKYRRPESENERNSVEIGREKELLKAFERILEEAQTGKKKIKEVRKEAVALGFIKAYQEKRYQDILMVAKRLDKQILENNSEINDFVEIAELKVGDNL